MKTTVHIPDPLFQEARRLARRDGVTLKVLIEEGLREIVAKRSEAKPYKLRIAAFKGDGLQPEFENAGWEKFREAIYEGHGG